MPADAFEESADDAGRPQALVLGALPELELERTLIVIPCSRRKRCGGTDIAVGDSLADWLPGELASELLEARRRNARSVRLDESRTMPAFRRYQGTLYGSAAGALERVEESGANVVVVSGGYGVVASRDPIGWYDQQFAERMWPQRLVARCLSAYAASTKATTVLGLLDGTTAYAKVYREVQWPPTVENAWLASPDLNSRCAQRAIGEALAEIADSGDLPEGWTSSDGVPLRIDAMRRKYEDRDGAAERPLLDGENGG